MYSNTQQNNNNPYQQPGPYKYQKPPGTLDNVSMENNLSNMSKSKSNRSGFDQQFMVKLNRIQIRRIRI